MNIEAFRKGGKELLVDGAWHRYGEVSTRWIFFIGNKVVKLGDSYQCTNEKRLFDCLGEEEKKYFPEVLDHGVIESADGAWYKKKDYVVMERVYLDRDPDKLLVRQFYKIVKNLYEKIGLSDLCETCPYIETGNWGITKDRRMYIVDYGMS